MAKGLKTGGREQGTPNLLTNEMRIILKGIIAKELESLPDTIVKLEPEKRIEVLIKLLPYIMPKVEAVHMTTGEPLNFYL